MDKEDWLNTLDEFGFVISGKYNDVNDSYEVNSDDSYEETNRSKHINMKIDLNINVNITELINESKADELVNKSKADESVNESSPQNEPNINIEFSNKRELYDYYGIQNIAIQTIIIC